MSDDRPWHNQDKLSNIEIAYHPGKSPQTINNEVKHGEYSSKRSVNTLLRLMRRRYETILSHQKITTDTTGFKYYEKGKIKKDLS